MVAWDVIHGRRVLGGWTTRTGSVMVVARGTAVACHLLPSRLAYWGDVAASSPPALPSHTCQNHPRPPSPTPTRGNLYRRRESCPWNPSCSSAATQPKLSHHGKCQETTYRLRMTSSSGGSDDCFTLRTSWRSGTLHYFPDYRSLIEVDHLPPVVMWDIMWSAEPETRGIVSLWHPAFSARRAGQAGPSLTHAGQMEHWWSFSWTWTNLWRSEHRPGHAWGSHQQFLKLLILCSLLLCKNFLTDALSLETLN